MPLGFIVGQKSIVQDQYCKEVFKSNRPNNVGITDY